MATADIATRAARPSRTRAVGMWLTTRVILVIALLFFIFPVAYAVMTAFQPPDVALRPEPTYIFRPTIEAFRRLFVEHSFIAPLLNSVFSSVGASVAALIVGVPAGYALSRARARGLRAIGFWLLAARALPAIGLGIPAYVLFNRVGMTDDLTALVIVYLPYNLALVTLMMRVYFDGIPTEIDEAALVDGAGRIRALRSVILPIARPGVASVAIMAFLFSWNNFFFPLVLTGSRAGTIPLALQQFLGSYTLQWNEVMAGVSLLSLPVIILSLLFGRYMVGGLAAGAVK